MSMKCDTPGTHSSLEQCCAAAPRYQLLSASNQAGVQQLESSLMQSQGNVSFKYCVLQEKTKTIWRELGNGALA